MSQPITVLLACAHGLLSVCITCKADLSYCPFIRGCSDDRKIECKENGGQCFYFMTSGPPQQGEGNELEQTDEPEGDNEFDAGSNAQDDEEQAEDAVEEGEEEEEGEDEEGYQYPDDIVALARRVTAMLWALKY